MAAEKPPMQTTPLTKTVNVPVEVPIDFEMAGYVCLVFDKKMQRPVLEFPVHNIPLSLLALNIIQNTMLQHATGAVQELTGGVEKTKSGLWTPPGFHA